MLEKGTHTITVDNCVLKMTVRLLTDEVTVQVRAQFHQSERLYLSACHLSNYLGYHLYYDYLYSILSLALIIKHVSKCIARI